MPANNRDETGRNTAVVTVRVDGEPWTQTASLADARPTERVFEVTKDGRVVFGDGKHGAQPPAGSSVIVSYDTGGGSRPDSVIAVTSEWPPSRSRYSVTVDRQGFRLSTAGDEVEQFTGLKRVNYFHGKLLDADDFRDEQQYLITKHRRHNQLLHGWGVVTGLGIGTSSATEIAIEPGVALDPAGREVCVPEPMTVPVTAQRSPQFVIVCYHERPSHPVPDSGGPDDTSPSRIEEGVSVMLAGTADVDDGVAIARIVREARGWRVDRTFRPRRVHG